MRKGRENQKRCNIFERSGRTKLRKSFAMCYVLYLALIYITLTTVYLNYFVILEDDPHKKQTSKVVRNFLLFLEHAKIFFVLISYIVAESLEIYWKA